MGEDHPRLPALANDLAYAWMSHGEVAPALKVFEAVRTRCTAVEENLAVLVNISPAAAGCGDRPRYEEAWGEAWSIAHTLKGRDRVAQAMLELAHGASLMREWARAEMAARCALATADNRREAQIQLTAESVLERIAHDRSRNLYVLEAPSRPYAFATEQESLAEDLAESLTSRAGATF